MINKNVQRKKPNERILRINIVSDSRDILDEDIEENFSVTNGSFCTLLEPDRSVSNDDVLTTRGKTKINIISLSLFQGILLCTLIDVRS